LLFASHLAIMLSGKKNRQRKICSKKWYLERDISCDVHLLNGLLETGAEVEYFEMVPSWCGKVN
jgi:hypothetical protein